MEDCKNNERLVYIYFQKDEIVWTDVSFLQAKYNKTINSTLFALGDNLYAWLLSRI